MQRSATTNVQAPELRVQHWIDGEGQPRAPLKLADLGSGYKVIYCFQHWCPGCHTSGFPVLQKLVDTLSTRGVGFAVVQTVFEGAEVNTPDRLRETQLRYRLKVPFGHDVAVDRFPIVMRDFHTGGTPWFIVIDPAGCIVHSDFHIDVNRVIAPADAGKSPGVVESPARPPRWSQLIDRVHRGNLAPPRRVEKLDKE